MKRGLRALPERPNWPGEAPNPLDWEIGMADDSEPVWRLLLNWLGRSPLRQGIGEPCSSSNAAVVFWIADPSQTIAWSGKPKPITVLPSLPPIAMPKMSVIWWVRLTPRAKLDRQVKARRSTKASVVSTMPQRVTSTGPAAAATPGLPTWGGASRVVEQTTGAAPAGKVRLAVVRASKPQPTATGER